MMKPQSSDTENTTDERRGRVTGSGKSRNAGGEGDTPYMD